MTIAEELMQEELEAHGYGDIHLCYARISNLKSAIKEINSLEQQNTALQARIKELEEQYNTLHLHFVEQSNAFGDKIEKEYQEFGG